jgi:hypothetical protein
MLVVRISLMVLRVAVLAALVLGILFWAGNADNLVLVHMGIGILVVISLWVMGIAQGLQGGSFGFALATFVVGFFVLLVGLFQTRWLIGPNHWIIQVIHLLLGLSAISLGEMIGGRYRKMMATKATA